MISALKRAGLLAGCVMAGAGSALAAGPGLHAGDLMLHPEVFAMGGYDNNVFYEGDDEAPKGSSLMRVGLGLRVENRSPNKVSLEAGADASYRHFFAEGQEFEARNTIDRAGVSATLGFFPRSPVTVEIHENGGFRDNPAFDDTEFGFRLFDNSLGLDVRFRPGENPDSRPFEMRLGYRWQTVNFLGDDAEELNTTVAEKDAHHLRFLTSWRFLPKTALQAEVGWSALSYEAPLDVSVFGAGGASTTESANRDARPFFATLGVKGLVTRRLSTVLKAGYKNTFNTAGTSFSSVIATAELTYAVEPSMRATLGYNRDGRDNAFSNYYTLNQVYGAGDFYFLGRWSAGGRVAFDHYDFSDDVGGIDRPEPHRSDPVLRGSVYAGFSPKEWMALKLEFTSQANFSEFQSGIPVETAGGDPAAAEAHLDPVAYSRQLVMFELQVNY